jgi:hypothetical protein
VGDKGYHSSPVLLDIEAAGLRRTCPSQIVAGADGMATLAVAGRSTQTGDAIEEHADHASARLRSPSRAPWLPLMRVIDTLPATGEEL